MNVKRIFFIVIVIFLKLVSIKAQSYTEAFDSVFAFVSRTDATTPTSRPSPTALSQLTTTTISTTCRQNSTPTCRFGM